MGARRRRQLVAREPYPRLPVTLPAAAGAALSWGQARYRAGARGKTLLVGWCGEDAVVSVAAGLSSPKDREQFGVLARYLLRRGHADGYWLLTSVDIDDVPHLAAECVAPHDRLLCAAPLPADERAGAGADPKVLPYEALLGDLLDGGNTLPAIMRRELERLAQRLAVPAPT